MSAIGRILMAEYGWLLTRPRVIPLLPRAGLTRVRGIVVGEDAARRPHVEMGLGDRDGGVGRGQARIRLFEFHVGRGVSGQHTMLHALRGNEGLRDPFRKQEVASLEPRTSPEIIVKLILDFLPPYTIFRRGRPAFRIFVQRIFSTG